MTCSVLSFLTQPQCLKRLSDNNNFVSLQLLLPHYAWSPPATNITILPKSRTYLSINLLQHLHTLWAPLTGQILSQKLEVCCCCCFKDYSTDLFSGWKSSKGGKRGSHKCRSLWKVQLWERDTISIWKARVGFLDDGIWAYMDWEKSLFHVVRAVCVKHSVKQNGVLGNSSTWLEYRAHKQVARHDAGEVGRPFWPAQEFELYHTGNEELIQDLTVAYGSSCILESSFLAVLWQRQRWKSRAAVSQRTFSSDGNAL